MINKTSKNVGRKKRHIRIRKYVVGVADKPRLSFYRSNRHIYAQIIDDTNACTLLTCSTLQPLLKNEFTKSWTMESAKKLGEILAKKALEKGIKKVVFDRGGFRFHGKVAAFANAARETGLEV